MSWTTPALLATGYDVAAADWNTLVTDLIFVKTSIDVTGTIWTGTVTGTCSGPLTGTLTGTVSGTGLVVPRVVSATTTTTLTPNSATTDITRLTAQATALTIAAPTGSPHDGQTLVVEIADNGTAQSLAWNAAYSGTLPVITVPGTTLVVTVVYDAATTTWISTTIPAIAPRVSTTTSTATATPNANTTDIYSLTAQAVALTIAAPTGSPVDGQALTIRLRDNGTAQTIAWNSAYVSAAGLPPSTLVGHTLTLRFTYQAALTAWVADTGARLVWTATSTTLPADALGSLALLTDTHRNVMAKSATQWFAVSGGVFDVGAFGAVGDGTTDDTAAIQAAINAAAAVYGGVVRLEANKTYHCASQLVLDKLTGVTIEGQSAALTYSGTTDPFLSMRSTSFCTLRRLQVLYTNTAFTGSLVKTGHNPTFDSAYLLFESCWFGNSGSATGGYAGIFFDLAIVCTVRDCRFFGLTLGIQGTVSTDYSNSITIETCTFTGLSTTGIYNAGDRWLIQGCTFEPLASGAPGAYNMAGGGLCYGLTFLGNWFGDATASGTWINNVTADGFTAIGNHFGAIAGGSTYVAMRFVGSQGVAIMGNRFESAALDFPTSTTHGLTVVGNDFNGATTAWANTLYDHAFIAGNYGGPMVVQITGLPTADPHLVGALWANAGVLTVSAG